MALTLGSFANIPTQKMYLFLLKKVTDKEITHQEIADTFEKYQKNPGGYLYALKTGVSIQLDHILKAQKHFGLNPCDLFGQSKKNKAYEMNETFSLVAEDSQEKRLNVNELIVTIRSQQETIRDLLTRLGNSDNPDRKKGLG